MSYEKVNTISFLNNGDISINSAPSSVRPIRYRTEKIRFKENIGPEEKKRSIFENLLGGTFQFNKGSTSRTFYAYLKVREYLRNERQMIPSDLWIYKDPTAKYNYSDIFWIKQELYAVFEKELESDISMTDKVYALKLDSGAFVTRVNKKTYHSTFAGPIWLRINQAMSYQNIVGGDIISKENYDK